MLRLCLYDNPDLNVLKMAAVRLLVRASAVASGAEGLNLFYSSIFSFLSSEYFPAPNKKIITLANKNKKGGVAKKASVSLSMPKTSSRWAVKRATIMVNMRGKVMILLPRPIIRSRPPTASVPPAIRTLISGIGIPRLEKKLTVLSKFTSFPLPVRKKLYPQKSLTQSKKMSCTEFCNAITC